MTAVAPALIPCRFQGQISVRGEPCATLIGGQTNVIYAICNTVDEGDA